LTKITIVFFYHSTQHTPLMVMRLKKIKYILEKLYTVLCVFLFPSFISTTPLSSPKMTINEHPDLA